MGWQNPVCEAVLPNLKGGVSGEFGSGYLDEAGNKNWASPPPLPAPSPVPTEDSFIQLLIRCYAVGWGLRTMPVPVYQSVEVPT